MTNDAYLDWNPVWSPDGGHLYFSSDRGGSMNLWHVAIDSGTGALQGAPEPMTTPSPDSAQITLSADGRRLAYVQRVATRNVQMARFDAGREKVAGEPDWVTQGSRLATSPEISRDGKWLTFNTIAPSQEDIFVVAPDGSGLRQLTDDAHRDRAARWSPVDRALRSTPIAAASTRCGRSIATGAACVRSRANDGRRVLFCFKEKLYLTDTASKKVREIMHSALSARTGEMLGIASLSPDERTLFFAQGTIEADVWLLTGSAER